MQIAPGSRARAEIELACDVLSRVFVESFGAALDLDIVISTVAHDQQVSPLDACPAPADYSGDHLQGCAEGRA